MVRNACHMHLTLLIGCSVRKCLRRRVAYRSLNLTLDVWRMTFILQKKKKNDAAGKGDRK